MCLRTGRVHDQLMRANVDRCCCSEDGGQSRAYAGGGPRACSSVTDMGAGVLGGLQGELRHMANMSAMRRTAIVAGLFYLATEVTAIPALLLYQPVLRDGNYIAGANADNRALLGG